TFVVGQANVTCRGCSNIGSTWPTSLSTFTNSSAHWLRARFSSMRRWAIRTSNGAVWMRLCEPPRPFTGFITPWRTYKSNTLIARTTFLQKSGRGPTDCWTQGSGSPVLKPALLHLIDDLHQFFELLRFNVVFVSSHLQG